MGATTKKAASAAVTATATLALVVLPAHAASADEDSEHKVVAGDTVWDLARAYGTSADAIIAANRLNSAALIRIGQTLVIPGATSTGSGAAGQVPSSSTHVVVAGDTLYDLARTYGTTVTAISTANSITNPSLIRIGQKLTIPGRAPAVATSQNVGEVSSSSTHVVVAGDTLYDLARKYGTTVTAISTANSITNPSLIRIGQKLTIPGGAASGLVGDTFAGRTYPEKVVAAANQNKATLNAMDVPTRSQMQQLVIQTAKDFGVDPVLAQAVAYQESGFNQRAVSPANAIGCMQVIPSSGEWASDIVGRELNLLDPEDNVTAGIAILKVLLRNGTPIDTALAGYYQGESSVRKNGMHDDTVQYVASVKALMAKFD